MGTPNLITPSQARPDVLTPVVAGTGLAAAFTSPVDSAVKIETAVICNKSGSAITFTICLVPQGSAASTSNALIDNAPLAAGDSLPLNDYLSGTWLGEGDFIAISASAGNAAVLSMSGTTYT